MFGHRVAVLLRLPGPSRLLRPNACTTSAKFAPIILNSARRAFATPGRPKGAVGEPSKPVKRAVKKAASGNGKSAATKKVAAKKKTAAKKKPAKKVLTEEQKARREKIAANRKVRTAAAKQKTRLADLKAAALEPPKIATSSAYLAFSKETRSGSESLKGSTHAEIKSSLANKSREVAAAWKNLAPADIEHYNHIARTARETSQAEHKRWVDSHTPAEILAANRARAALRLKTKSKGPGSGKWAAIKDERLVKQPLSSYVLFSTDRHSSGDFANIKIGDRAKLIAQEWKALSESEKDKYNRLAAQDKERYVEEYTATYGEAPPAPKARKSSTSS